MTTRFRVDAVRLTTTNGEVAYAFPAGLTVLEGGVGVGKSTLFELIKFACGGNALIADVAQKHVIDVAVDLTVGEARLGLVRAVTQGNRSTVRVTDLVTAERLRDHSVGDQEPSLSDLLLDKLGIPNDLQATSKSNRATRAGNRITFNDIFTFLYVPQSEISRDIAHSRENVREPKRRAVFELLFGFTDADALKKRAEAAKKRHELQEARVRSETIQDFLLQSGTTTQMEAQIRLGEAEKAEQDAARALGALRSELEPAADRRTQALRDLLNQAERSLSDARANRARLKQQILDRQGEASAIRQDLGRLDRMEAAGVRLAEIEFKVCPRCLQGLERRAIPDGHCRLCLQADPVEQHGTSAMAEYERGQLTAQLDELTTQVELAHADLGATELALQHRTELVAELTSEIDERTRDRVTPRLQAYEDANRTLEASRAAQRELEQVLRQWDVARDASDRIFELERLVERLTRDADGAEEALAARKKEVLKEITSEFEDAVRSIGIPGVEKVAIDETTYLPLLNDKKFTEFNPAGGGINTATQVAYWMSLLTVALRRRDTLYPAFMLLDSPRTSLNNENGMAKALYGRIARQTGVDESRLQVIIADNELPKDFRQQGAQIRFDYDRPSIWTIEHPGPASVRRIGVEEPAPST